MAAGNSSTAFHQTVCRTARLHSPSERDEERERERTGVEWGMRRGEEDETGGGGGRGGGKREAQEDRCHHCGRGIVGY